MNNWSGYNILILSQNIDVHKKKNAVEHYCMQCSCWQHVGVAMHNVNHYTHSICVAEVYTLMRSTTSLAKII